MLTKIEDLNIASREAATESFISCCGSQRWAARMTQARPFKNIDELLERAEQIWWNLEKSDWLEAFASHPKIGERPAKSHPNSQSSQWSTQEQSGVDLAASETLNALTEVNSAYEKKFGYIFIVCATGKSAQEMLALCRQRLSNDPKIELRIAAEEQRKITEIRLKKFLGVLESDE